MRLEEEEEDGDDDAVDTDAGNTGDGLEETAEIPVAVPVDDRTPLEIAEEQAGAALAALQREKADFLNYKKRVQREKDDVRLAASRAWAETLLPVLDNLELALQAGGDPDALRQGVDMILHEFDRALGMLGVEPIAAVAGEPFNPDHHEAFGAVPSEEHPPGTIAMVLQRGFAYQGRVLRAARVQVVAPPVAPAAPAEEEA